jgi:hypothetical protein
LTLHINITDFYCKTNIALSGMAYLRSFLRCLTKINTYNSLQN